MLICDCRPRRKSAFKNCCFNFARTSGIVYIRGVELQFEAVTNEPMLGDMNFPKRT